MADFHSLAAAADSHSRLGRFDARLKIMVVIAAITVNLLSVNIIAPLLIAAITLGSLAISDVPLRRVVLRLGLPLMMAAVIFLTQLFLYGETVIGHTDVFGVTISAYSEGLERGLLIVGRVIGGASLVVWLSLSTPVQQLIVASQWFRVSKVVVEIMALMYRFIFVLLEEIITSSGFTSILTPLNFSLERMDILFSEWRNLSRLICTMRSLATGMTLV